MTSTNPQPPPNNIPPHSNDPAIELPLILSALQTVYAPNLSHAATVATTQIATPFSTRDQADSFLTTFQRLPIAWTICLDSLLASPSSLDHPSIDPSTLQQRHFFAAQTLHYKCQDVHVHHNNNNNNNIHSLSPTEITSLRDSISHHFCRYAADIDRATGENRPCNNRPLVGRLGMALAALAVQMNWTDVLDDWMGVLESRPELTWAVLELFQSIPEECSAGGRWSGWNDDSLEEEKEMFRRGLKEKAGRVLELCERAVGRSWGYRQQQQQQQMTQHQQQLERSSRNDGGYPNLITPTHHHQDVATTEAVLSCLISWIRIVDMSPILLQNSMLIPWIFDYLLTDSTNGGYELAVDVVVQLMRSYTSEFQQNRGLIMVIVPRVMALGGISSSSSSSASGIGSGNTTIGMSAFEKAIREEDEDGMRGYCRIFTEMGEAYLSLILSHEELNQEVLVELVLKCAGIPDKGVLNNTTMLYIYVYAYC